MLFLNIRPLYHELCHGNTDKINALGIIEVSWPWLITCVGYFLYFCDQIQIRSTFLKKCMYAVSGCVFAYVWGGTHVHVYTWVWKPEVDMKCPLQLFPTLLFVTALLTEHGAHCCSWANWVTGPQDLSLSTTSGVAVLWSVTASRATPLLLGFMGCWGQR